MTEKTPGKEIKKATINATELQKVPTAIPGLDDVLHGGLPAGRTTLAIGGPGSGKSILGMQFLYHGAKNGEPGIFVVFEERAEAVRQNALTLGWDLALLEKVGKLFLYEAHVDPQAVLSGNFTIKGLLSIMEGKARSMEAKRIVIDAIDILLRLFNDPVRERGELYALFDWLNDHKMTAVLTLKEAAGAVIATRYEFLDFMADCVIHFDHRVIDQVPTRRLRVTKYRGSGFFPNECPFIIREGGVNVIPISGIEMHHKALGVKISSGLPRLDNLLDGGFRRASSILISGASGTGKTILATTFAVSACKHGEKVLYINFEESAEVMVSCMLSVGIDLRSTLQKGKLRIMTAMPESVGSGEHLLNTLKTIEEFQPDHVIVDAVSSCKRMGTPRGAYEYIMLLINACKEKGITTFLTNQTEGFQEEHEFSGVGISSNIDTVLFLRYVDIGGEVNRVLLVMKARGQKHSNQYREFRITDHGIDITDVYAGEGDVLTGVARQEQEAKEAVEFRRKKLEIEYKEHFILQKKAEMTADISRRHAELAVIETEMKSLQLEVSLIADRRNSRANMRTDGNVNTRRKTPALKNKRQDASRKGRAK
jgi:circadian clock protein KaiC